MDMNPIKVFVLTYVIQTEAGKVFKKTKVFGRQSTAFDFIHQYNEKMKSSKKECVHYNIEVVDYNLTWDKIKIDNNTEKTKD